MLNENIKAIRKAKGLSQEELAVKLNVVRQTVSKWEHGLSVPDSEMLLSLSEVLETPVSVLLGETVMEPQADDLKAISEKLEIINLQLARSRAARRKTLWGLLIALFAAALALLLVGAAVLCWQNQLPDNVIGYADAATGLYISGPSPLPLVLFGGAAPLILIAAVIGAVLTRRKG